MEFKAGKYIAEVKGEKRPPKATSRMMIRRELRGMTECTAGGP